MIGGHRNPEWTEPVENPRDGDDIAEERAEERELDDAADRFGGGVDE